MRRTKVYQYELLKRAFCRGMAMASTALGWRIRIKLRRRRARRDPPDGGTARGSHGMNWDLTAGRSAAGLSSPFCNGP